MVIGLVLQVDSLERPLEIKKVLLRLSMETLSLYLRKSYSIRCLSLESKKN